MNTNVGLLDNFLKGVEYDQVLIRLCDDCVTLSGRDLLMDLRPLGDVPALGVRLEKTRLIEQHRIRHDEPPVPEPQEIAIALQKARENGETFSGHELATLAVFLDGVVSLRKWLCLQDGETPQFPEWLGKLNTCPGLRAELSRSVSESGEILDDASVALKSARNELRASRSDSNAFFQQLMNRPDLQESLRERTVTERSGRWVVPLRRDQQFVMPGIVHGVSSSGSTVFMEPREAIALNDRMAEAMLREEEEVRRVLRELTAKILLDAEALVASMAVCAEVDMHSALACFATRFGGQYLLPEQGVCLWLKDARHPLLCLENGSEYKEKVVALDLESKDGTSIFLLSGPNAGGKTVALKTVGLLCALASSGMPVPASTLSRIPLLDHFDTDLNDGQSLSSHLSTYEAKLRALNRMLTAAGPTSLLLLDELGAGTDPQEGGAVGLACLEAFREKHAIVFATTHQPLLKLFAQEEKGMMNAAMLMDEETGRPTYRFVAGLPGRSYAMELATQVGLPASVLEKAKHLLPKGELDLSEVLARLQSERQILEKIRLDVERTRDGIKKTEAELLEAKRQIKDEAKRIRREASIEAEGILKNTRRQMEHILQGVRPDSMTDKEKIRLARRDVEVKLSHLSRNIQAPQKISEIMELTPGLEVRYKPGNLIAKVLEADDVKQHAVLQSGNGPRFDCRYEDLGIIEGHAERPASVTIHYKSADENEAVKIELDIRGFRVEQGLQSVQKFLDKAMIGRLPFVRILHGKGTGKLKEAILDCLKTHPGIRAFKDAEYNQGGSGVTVIDMLRD